MCLLRFTFHLKEKKTFRFEFVCQKPFCLSFLCGRGCKITVMISQPTVSSHCEPWVLLEHFSAFSSKQEKQNKTSMHQVHEQWETQPVAILPWDAQWGTQHPARGGSDTSLLRSTSRLVPEPAGAAAPTCCQAVSLPFDRSTFKLKLTHLQVFTYVLSKYIWLRKLPYFTTFFSSFFSLACWSWSFSLLSVLLNDSYSPQYLFHNLKCIYASLLKNGKRILCVPHARPKFNITEEELKNH